MLFVVTVCSWAIGSCLAATLDDWHWENPSAGTDQLLAVAYGNDRWISVAPNSTVITSTDGTNWQRQMAPTPTPQLTASIAFGNSVFLVPYWTNCYRTTDGTNWSATAFAESSGESGQAIDRIVFVEGEFFGLGQSRYLIASTNGIQWTVRHEVTEPTLGSVRSLVYGNSTYVALSGRTEVMISRDGKAWEVLDLSFPTSRLMDITFREGLFYAVAEVGRVYSSPNGVDWTEIAVLECEAERIISAGNGLYVITDNCPGREMMFSTDGVNWTDRSIGTRTYLTALAFEPSAGFVVVGYTFWGAESLLAGAVFSSTDGVEWARRDRGFHHLLDDIIYGGGKFVAAGGLLTTNGTVMVSTNGADWTRASLATTTRLRRVGYGNGTYVVLGRNNQRNPPTPIYTSTDAMNWSLQTNATNIGTFLNAIIHAEDKFVAVGFSNTIARSADGATWTSESLHNGDSLLSITYGNGTFVAVGEKSRVDAAYPDNILISADGILWTRQTIGPAAKELRVVAFGDGRFVALGETNSFTSTDGVQWTSHLFPSAAAKEKLAFGNGHFVVVTRGPQFGTLFNSIYSSRDGETWTEHETRTKEIMRAVAFGADRFVAVTDLSGILRSDPVPDDRTELVSLNVQYLPESRKIELTLTGEPSGYRIEATDGLEVLSWTELGPVSANGTFSAEITGRTRFYRAVKR
jgi:hypothetical protein